MSMNNSAVQGWIHPSLIAEMEYFGSSHFIAVHSFCADIKSTCGELSVRPGALMYCECTDWFARDTELPEANQHVSSSVSSEVNPHASCYA